MLQNKLHLTITQDGDTGWYRVEMRDHHCNYCCVYEPSVKQAMQKLDKEKGILTGNYDGLD